MSYTIVCRAQVSDDCYDGSPTKRQFGEDLPMRNDGTYDWQSDSIVCDACYLMVLPFTRSGMGEYDELGEAIGHLHAQVRFLCEHDNPQELVDEAERRIGELTDTSTAYYRSGMALKQLAEAEVERRKVS